MHYFILRHITQLYMRRPYPQIITFICGNMHCSETHGY